MDKDLQNIADELLGALDIYARELTTHDYYELLEMIWDSMNDRLQARNE